MVIKETEPIRIAEATGIAPAVGSDYISPVFARLLPEVYAHLTTVGARPRKTVAHYEDPADDGSVSIHVGFDVGNQDVAGTDRVRVVELPIVRVASVMHRGPVEGIADAYGELIRWATDSGYTLAGPSRELYQEWHPEDLTRHLTELQLLLAP